jgi:hypothetical protein
MSGAEYADQTESLWKKFFPPVKDHFIRPVGLL